MYTYDQTLQALHDVVDGDPNRTNATMGGCYLFQTNGSGRVNDYDCNKPVCVVGHVLTRLDVACDVEYSNGGFVSEQYKEFSEHFTDAAITLLDDVQTVADNGGIGNIPWGVALNGGVDTYMERL